MITVLLFCPPILIRIGSDNANVSEWAAIVFY